MQFAQFPNVSSHHQKGCSSSSSSSSSLSSSSSSSSSSSLSSSSSSLSSLVPRKLIATQEIQTCFCWAIICQTEAKCQLKQTLDPAILTGTGISTKNIETKEVWEFSCITIWNPAMTLILIGKKPCFEGLTFKIRGHWGSRYMYIYINLNIYIYMYFYLHTPENPVDQTKNQLYDLYKYSIAFRGATFGF